ncbi:MAG: hypothetical protein DCC65_01465 [Planctomycetota bacterium]|nr:MAG: hypothetical protein DCC65_01465 [Planctomycetota bacterium]
MNDPRDDMPRVDPGGDKPLDASAARREPSLAPAVDGETAARAQPFYPGLPSGTGIGKYRILERIRTYHNAVVYKARDLMLDRLVAVKQMSPGLIDNPVACGNFRREAQLLARIPKDARHIVNIHELIEDEAGLFIVEEFVHGHWLESLIFKRLVDYRHAYRLLKTAAMGLRTLHAHMIVHRDIHPGNIIVTRGGGAKIANLASAAHEGDLSAPPVITPRYAAPEMLLEKRYDNRVDIYALGLVFYELCVGRAAFEKHFAEIVASPFPVGRWIDWQTDLAAALPHPGALNALIPPRLAGILQRMTAKDLAQRYTTVDEILDDVAALLTGRDGSTGRHREIEVEPGPGRATTQSLFPASSPENQGSFPLATRAPGSPTRTIRAVSEAAESPNERMGDTRSWEYREEAGRTDAESFTTHAAPYYSKAEPPGPCDRPFEQYYTLPSDIRRRRRRPRRNPPYGATRYGEQRHGADYAGRDVHAGAGHRGRAAEGRFERSREARSPRPIVSVAIPAPPPVKEVHKKHSPRILLWTLGVFLFLAAGLAGGGAIWYYQYGPGLHNPIEAILDRGIAEYEAGNYSAAEAVFEEARRTKAKGQTAPVWRERARFWLDMVHAQIALENNKFETVQSLLRDAQKRGVNPAKVDELQQKAWQKRDALRLAEEGMDELAQGNLPAVEAKLDEYAEKAAAAGMDPEKLKDSLSSTKKDMKYREFLKKGHEALRQGEFLEAITACEKAEELQITVATRELRRAIESAQSRKQWVDKGDQAMVDRDFAEAERCYNRAISILPGVELERKSRLARAYVLIDEANETIRDGDLLEAEKKLKSSLWNAPTPEGQTRYTRMTPAFDAARLARRAELALETGNREEAIRLFEEAIRGLEGAGITGKAIEQVRKKLESQTKAATQPHD